MKFKLNRTEKFLIRYYKPMFFSYFIILVLASLFFGFMGWSTIGRIFNTILLIFMFYVIFVPMSKAKQIQQLNDVDFDILSMIDACNQMIDAYNPKDITHLSSFCLFRIIGLINLGDFDRAEQEIKFFWQHFNLKKIHPSDIAQTHSLMANIALEKDDIKLFEDEMRIVYEYGNKPAIVGTFKHSYNYNVKGMELLSEAYFANRNNCAQDYEHRVFEHMNTNPLTGKPLKKKPKPMYYLMACSKLFMFYKNTDNNQKATYYAQQLLSIGNEQLNDYRKAKEYLENADRSN